MKQEITESVQRCICLQKKERNYWHMTKQDIKMIGLDLDGTLLNSEKVFTDYSKEVLGEAIRQGVIVLPATGRPLTGIPKEVLEFPGIRYALTSNGARVVDLKENKVLYECLLRDHIQLYRLVIPIPFY